VTDSERLMKTIKLNTVMSVLVNLKRGIGIFPRDVLISIMLIKNQR
jgi:hypothetical protein